MGVRTAERMTGVSMKTSVKDHYMGCARRWRGVRRFARTEANLRVRRKKRRDSVAPLWKLRWGGCECSSRGGVARGFVGAGSIEPGYGDTEQAEIYPQLRAMMNQVVHQKAGNARDARHGKNLFTAG